MSHASAADAATPAPTIPLLSSAEATDLIRRTRVGTPDMAVPTMALTHRACLEMAGHENIGNQIEFAAYIFSMHWSDAEPMHEMIAYAAQRVFPDDSDAANADKKYAFAMAVLEEMTTTPDIIAAVKAHFLPTSRENTIKRLKATGVITTDRDALIKANKYNTIDDAAFVAQDRPILFSSMDHMRGTLKKEGERQVVEVMVEGKPVKCLRYNARGNGDCGLIALGLRRSEMQAAFEQLKPFIHTGADPDDITMLRDEMRTRIFRTPTNDGENAHIDTSDATTLGYTLYGARTYVQYVGDSPHADHLHIRSTLQNYYIGKEKFAPDAPKIFLQLSPGHFDMLVPEENITLRKYAAHVEFYSAFSSMVSQAYAHKHDGVLNHTRLDENITHLALPLASDKLQFNMTDLTQIVAAYETDTPESLATIPGIIAEMLA